MTYTAELFFLASYGYYFAVTEPLDIPEYRFYSDLSHPLQWDCWFQYGANIPHAKMNVDLDLLAFAYGYV